MPLVALCSVLVAACVLATAYGPWNEANGEPPAQDAPAPEAELVAAPEQAEDGAEIIGSYRAISQSANENRAENVRLAAETIDGAIIEPGETFSFNDAVGDTEHDERYLMAPIISDDEMVDGRGGGICQVSTALYIAALKSGLDVVERHAHTLVSDYAPVGLDATLAYGLLDLKIRNNTDYPVRIDARALGQTVDVALYGHPLAEGESIDATSKVIDRFEVDEQSAGEEGALSPGTYYVAESYRIFYRNGVKTSSELLAANTYKVGDSESVSLGEGSVDPTK